MIKVYTGTPGAGKSLHATKVICSWLEEGKNVIANFPMLVDKIKKNNGRFFYQPNEKITVPYLMQFAQTMHEERKEHQTLIVIDEASVKFNARTFMDEDRLDFLSFFAQHRHYGYEIIMITQNLHQIDRQIRDLSEIEVHHRNAKNFWVYKLIPFSLFIAIEKNLAVKDQNSSYFFTYSKYYGGLYDTFFEFNHKIVAEPTAVIQKQILESEIIPKDRQPKKTPKQPKTTGKAGRPRPVGRVPQGGPSVQRARPARPENLVDELFKIE